MRGRGGKHHHYVCFYVICFHCHLFHTRFSLSFFLCSYCLLGFLLRQFHITCGLLGIIVYLFGAFHCSCVVGYTPSIRNDDAYLSPPHDRIIIRVNYAQIAHKLTIKSLCCVYTITSIYTRVYTKDWSEPTHYSHRSHSHIYSPCIKRCRTTTAMIKSIGLVIFWHLSAAKPLRRFRKNTPKDSHET